MEHVLSPGARLQYGAKKLPEVQFSLKQMEILQQQKDQTHKDEIFLNQGQSGTGEVNIKHKPMEEMWMDILTKLKHGWQVQVDRSAKELSGGLAK